MQYEIFYLVGISLESELAKIKKEVMTIITSAGGEFLEKETEEKRRLSYQIKHETHGIYIARRFELANKENLKEITAKLNLNNNILRFVLSRADELPALKSKEERIAAAEQKEAKNQQQEQEEERGKESKKIKEKESKQEKTPLTPLEETPQLKKDSQKEKEVSSKTNTESLDKKLEEILNI
jgi:ribosomal protein S6